MIKSNVPSLIREFYHHDLAITGGGTTPFEANASGLPCIVIANELFEIPAAKALAKIGSSVFAGFHTTLEIPKLEFDQKIEKMSMAGIEKVGTNGINKVIESILALF